MFFVVFITNFCFFGIFYSEIYEGLKKVPFLYEISKYSNTDDRSVGMLIIALILLVLSFLWYISLALLVVIGIIFVFYNHPKIKEIKEILNK